MRRPPTASINAKDLRKMAALQCTRAEVAAFFGITTKAFRQILATNKKAREAWESGRGQGCISLRRKQMALAGVNATMAIHLGKQYLGQHEKTQHEVTGKDGGPIETRAIDTSSLSDEELDVLMKLVGRGDTNGV